MNTDSTPTPQPTTAPTDLRATTRRRRWIAVTAAGALILVGGTGAGAYALGNRQSTAGVSATRSSATGATFVGQPNATVAGPQGGDGSGYLYSGGFGAGPGASTSAGDGAGLGRGGEYAGNGGSVPGSPSTPTPFPSRGSAAGTSAASVSQSAGVVTIVSQLGYQQAAAAGTGIVLTSSGEILTNNHVVEGSTSITVTVPSTGRHYTAAVVGTDVTHDVAVLQLQNASGLTPAKIAANPVSVGSAVTGVGNAGGTGTLTAASGTVTALGQSITTQAQPGAVSEHLSGLIQTNANIQSGDSGGPLRNATGAVVGIDTAASVGSSTVAGFAIPIGTALGIADQIVAGHASAGVTIGYPAFLGIQVAQNVAVSGAGVARVVPNTPAAASGLVAGEVITSVDGGAITSGSMLSQVLAGHAPGDSVTIGYTNTTTGASATTQVVLAHGPAA